jgi:hypothetical protein
VGGRRPGLSAQVPKGSEPRRAIALYLVCSGLERGVQQSRLFSLLNRFRAFSRTGFGPVT